MNLKKSWDEEARLMTVGRAAAERIQRAIEIAIQSAGEDEMEVRRWEQLRKDFMAEWEASWSS